MIDDFSIYSSEELKEMLSMIKKELIKRETIDHFTTSDGTIIKTLEDVIRETQIRGLKTVDKRSMNGCVWFESSPDIDEIFKRLVINGIRFRYAKASRALDGKPGWYYFE